MRTIAKLIGFVEGFFMAILTFMAAFGFFASWFNIDLRSINKSIDENSDL